MTLTTQARITDPQTHGPRLAALHTAFPPYRYAQSELTAALTARMPTQSAARTHLARKVQSNAGVGARHMSLPLDELLDLIAEDDFTQRNRIWLDTALDLGQQSITGALRTAGVDPQQVDALFSTTVTGLAVPSLETRLAHRMGLRQDVKRIPLFGSGCAGGAVGLARLHDYLRAHPGHVAVLLAVELCSLAYRQKDTSMANVVAGGLFGDGAAAVVAFGTHRPGAPGPELTDTHSWLIPDTEDILGWDIGSHGFKILLAPEVPTLTEEYVPKAAHDFLNRHGLTPSQIGSWIVHGGGPKVLTAVEQALGLPPQALNLTRQSLAARGNLSSVSVLDVLHRALKSPPPPGTPGLVTAMGPGFSIEQVLLHW
ncbi:type III polyketide synthase [Streptomyces lacrimifluminis]|uniref:Polyketide synthase-like Pks10 n=1 Tax=Streptomyces lacrimifluminis TaxID=1500077 RepID=A0A917UN94_9ACTN|nr:3-oxoacyl-[acyl-carrier-protein] synthase III C-terminal domain-containing protein [Streptomyces lacrimifluminis]GGJ70412.1 polyketide synthase-like Pks10 [Streptomyces lacrimifluminis]